MKVTHVKWEAGTDQYSYLTFDLAWENSWHAAWTEAADRNVTDAPLKLENWDAAWVFVKLRPTGSNDSAHATLSTVSADHQVPSGAKLDVGLSDDGRRGLGVFVYRDKVGRGRNDFRNVKLRWLHGADKADPGKVSLSVHAIGMVYVAEGAFQSKSPLRQSNPLTQGYESPGTPRLPLASINTRDATKPGGYYPVGDNVPENASWPNGYRAFYCMKRSITQGQYAELLNSVARDLGAANYNARLYKVMSNERTGRFSAGLYNLNGFTIRYDKGKGEYTADVSDRACNFLSWADILSYAAWAGLRPLTNLEYEKACRGPRSLPSGDDAWADGACVPAAGLGVPEKPASIYGPSYWGILDLSLGGCVQEWPATVGNGLKNIGLEFKGTHGDGSPEAPPDWPVTSAFGDWFTQSWVLSRGYFDVGLWVLPSEIDRVNAAWWAVDCDRTGRFGARAVRTAP
jgi:formylglycine-generating enzyme required for sulfatase activity